MCILKEWIYSEFLPEGKIVNKEYYLGIIKHLKEKVRRKQPDLSANNS